MVIRAYITHKQAELFVDCQDRFGVNTDTKSIAVSDGMGSTWQQKIWAQLLVDTYINSTDWCPSKETIKPLCQTWHSKVADFIQNLKETNAPENMIYRNERSFAEGRSAGATFVGIRFNGNEWSGSVLGDSCLIEWDGNEAKFYTSQDSGTFDSYPDYFDSDASKEGKGTPKPIEGVLKEGKCLLLVSDPFSEFLLEHSKQGDISRYIQQLLSLASHDDFETLVSEWRKEGMHNDDTTLVIVEYDRLNNLAITYKDDIVEMVKNEKLSQNSANDVIDNATTPQEKSPQEETESVMNFVIVQNSEKAFINEFLIEYHQCLQNKFPLLDEFRYKWTKRAVEEAFNLLFEKYSVIKK